MDCFSFHIFKMNLRVDSVHTTFFWAATQLHDVTTCLEIPRILNNAAVPFKCSSKKESKEEKDYLCVVSK